LFFFSSRRRHTRFSRDWSSDVCSSDLFSPSSRCLRVFDHRRRSGWHPRCPSRRRACDPKGERERHHPRTAKEASTGTIWRSKGRSEEHTSELQSRENIVCRLLLEKKNT